MKTPWSVSTLTDFGRVRLPKTFFMRDFLFSDIALSPRRAFRV